MSTLYGGGGRGVHAGAGARQQGEAAAQSSEVMCARRRICSRGLLVQRRVSPQSPLDVQGAHTKAETPAPPACPTPPYPAASQSTARLGAGRAAD